MRTLWVLSLSLGQGVRTEAVPTPAYLDRIEAHLSIRAEQRQDFSVRNLVPVLAEDLFHRARFLSGASPGTGGLAHGGDSSRRSTPPLEIESKPPAFLFQRREESRTMVPDLTAAPRQHWIAAR